MNHPFLLNYSKMADEQRDILPSSVKPKHYELSLFDLVFNEPFTYEGTVKIHVAVKESVQEIKLNAIDLKLFSAEISGQTVQNDAITYNEESQTATVARARPHLLPIPRS